MQSPGCRLAGPLLACLCATPLAAAEPAIPAAELTIVSAPIETFNGVAIGGAVGKLIWRGGLTLTSVSDQFGGLSGAGFVSDEQHMVFVTDRGNFISAQLIYDEANRPFSLIGAELEAVQNSKGAPLPRQFSRDAEALAVILRDGKPAAIRLGFENLTRVADFELIEHRPKGAAKEVPIPEWLSDTRTNESLEAVCIAPAASPIAGSTLLLTEGVINDDGQHVAFLLGVTDRGGLSYQSSPIVNPTDCAFLPNGDLLVLERGVALFSFTMTLRRVPAAEVRPGNLMRGEILLEATGGDIDNMEAVAVHTGPTGETLVTLMSDNNFNDWERNLLLEFSLAE
ncbi:MAG: hypothetical protein JWR75_2131 [Devosia sp.]|nr:hypothetical protein [Devosia sp.]